MCLKVPLKKKALSAPGFPPGWKFAFHDEFKDPAPGFNGLLLLAANTDRRYRTVERAVVSHIPSIRGKVDAEHFYRYVGLAGVSDPLHPLKHREPAPSTKKEVPAGVLDPLYSSVQKEVLLSTEKEIGARVFALYSNNAWYWGYVAGKKGNPPVFSVSEH
jgi:hypothetical protein